eukprot:SAG11_NODE_46733_length_134_cov_29.114286_1_plen_28_part_10
MGVKTLLKNARREQSNTPNVVFYLKLAE